MTRSNSGQELNLKVGELVEVASKEEILSTLDSNGRLDSLPFMPEMLQFCGHQFRVGKRADKTCDTITGTGGRRLRNSVHLENLRCDGKAHGGCQAGCLIFWKEAWLRRTPQPVIPNCTDIKTKRRQVNRTIPDLEHSACFHRNGQEFFSCQATELKNASSPLYWWDVRQYWRDVRSGNVRIWEAAGVLLRRIFVFAQRHTGGCPYPPPIRGTLTKTPTVKLNLQAGELVQIKTREEVERTLSKDNRNRGLFFDKDEMGPYCGGRFRVLSHVEQIIDERTGKLTKLPNDCVILDGVTCTGKFSHKRLFCPRAIYPYWREIWLKRVDESH